MSPAEGDQPQTSKLAQEVESSEITQSQTANSSQITQAEVGNALEHSKDSEHVEQIGDSAGVEERPRGAPAAVLESSKSYNPQPDLKEGPDGVDAGDDATSQATRRMSEIGGKTSTQEAFADTSLLSPKDAEKKSVPGTPESKGIEQEWNEKESYEDLKSSRQLISPEQDFDERPREGDVSESKPEIEHIIQQFGESQGRALRPDAALPKGSDLPVFQYPPRSSSLEHPAQHSSAPGIKSDSRRQSAGTEPTDAAAKSATYPPSIASQPLPPEPDPEPDLPFDFHRFLEQLRHRTADPVAKFLRSFLLEFSKKQWQVHEQVKIITDFLTFISGKMGQCEVWRTVSDAEFDNAREGMEKLVMNRLYAQTFSPEIPAVDPTRNKGRRSATPIGPGRKGQHQEDVERDEVLAQKVRIYGWIREEHLDIRPFGDKGKRFLTLAQAELSKIKNYRAPRDKVICVLNCCKVIFGYLRNVHSDQSADAFIPLLIYTVLKANPDHLVSNVQYILRFRNQDKLGGEAGYYMSSLLGAVQFIENLDRTNLTISDADFEANVEAAVSSIAEPHQQEEERVTSHLSPKPITSGKSTLSRPEVTPRHSSDAERSSPRRALSSSRQPQGSSENEDNAAMSGLLRTIQKPLSTIGRIFSDDGSAGAQQPTSRPPSTPRNPRSSPAQQFGPALGAPAQLQPAGTPLRAGSPSSSEVQSAEESAARQASAETAQAQRITQAEHKTVVETLAGMFPDLDADVISDVVRVKEGRIGLAVDACLALTR